MTLIILNSGSRRNARALAWLLVVGFILLASKSAAQAATYDLTPTGGFGSTSVNSLTLSTLMSDANAMVVIGDLVFNQFNYSELGDSAGAAGVSMFGYRDAQGDWGAKFQGAFVDTSDGIPSVAELYYGVSIQPSLGASGWRLSQGKLAMAGAAVGDDSYLAVSESFAERFDLLSVQATKLDAGPPQVVSFDEASLDPPAATLITTTEVLLSAGTSPSSSASLASFSQTFTREQLGNLTKLPGDFNEDRVVDSEDFLVWNNSFEVDEGGDANGDFLTDGSDFLYWQRYLGSVMPPTVASIPEPEAIGIAVAALVALACVRPRLMRSA